MTQLAELARYWLPPALIRGLERARGGARFEGPFDDWSAAAARCTGYDAEQILQPVLAAALQVKSGRAAFERDSVVFREREYEWPVLSGLFHAAAKSAGKLSVLDVGGSLGSSYYQHRPLLGTLAGLRWSIVEQPHFMRAGREHLQDDTLVFYGSVDECLQHETPNAVLLSSVLQYVPQPRELLARIAALDVETVIIDRTIASDAPDDRLFVQHVPRTIYRAAYPAWSLSASGLATSLAPRYTMACSFESLPFPALRRLNARLRGFLFLRETR